MQIIDSFDLSAKKFLDSRQLWDSFADLTANTAILMPIGFLAYCKEEASWYQLRSASDESDPTTYVWTLQSSDSVAIQLPSFPIIKEGEEEKLAEYASNYFYQYAGATDEEYTYGYFYRLEKTPAVKVLDSLPTDLVTEDSENPGTYIHSLEQKLGMIVSYTDGSGTTANYKLVEGANPEDPYTWEVTADTPIKYYNWTNVPVSDMDGQIIQVGTTEYPVPTPSSLNEGRIVQFVGTTNSTMRTGYFYKSSNVTFKAYNDSEATNPAPTIYITDTTPSKSSHFYLKNGDGTFGNMDLTYEIKSVTIDGATIKITYSDGTDDYNGEFTADTAADETTYAWKQIDIQASGEDREALLKKDLVASVEVGGVEVGDVISEDAPLEKVLRKILCPATPPEFTFTGNPAGGLVEKGTAVTTPQLITKVTSLGNNVTRTYQIVKPIPAAVVQQETTFNAIGDLIDVGTYDTAYLYDSVGDAWVECLNWTNDGTDWSCEVDGVTMTDDGADHNFKLEKAGTSQVIVAETPLAVTTYTDTTSDNITSDTTYTCIVTYTDEDDVSKTVPKSVKYEFVDASYHGIVNTATPDAATIAALTKGLSKVNKYTWTGITMTNKRMCYAYPASYGLLTKILDENNFTVTSSFDVLDVEIGGVAYKAYVTRDTSTLSNGKLIFE